MLIHSLALENVKSYIAAQIDFTPGTNAIVGQNGAGKSTILEAIGFALFDQLPYNQNEFKREGARSATVTVTFLSSRDDRAYQVVRRWGSSNQYAVYDPELNAKVCQGKKDVLDFLREHMGVDPNTDLRKLFADAVGVPQGTLTAAFLQSPANRKPIFDPLLRVQEYKKAYERLNEPQRLLRAQSQELEVRISRLEGRVERLPELEERLKRLQAGIEQGRQELAQATAERTQLQEKVQALEALEKQLRDAERAWEQAQSQVDSLTAQLQQARKRLEEALEAQDLLERHRAGYQAYQEAQARKQALDARFRERETLRERRAQLDKQLSLAQSQVQRLEEELAAIQQAEEERARLAPLVARQQELEAELAQVQQAAVRLEAVERELDQLRNEEARRRERLAQLEQALARAQELEAELAQARGKVETLRAALQEGRDRLARLAAETEALEKQNQALEAVEQAVCPVCEQPLTPEHRAELLERNRIRLAQLGQERQALEAKLAATQEELDRAEQRVQELEGQLRRLPRPDELAKLREELAQIQEKGAAAEAERQALAQEAARLDGLKQALDELGNPRQRQEVAAHQAQRLPQVEAALAQERAQVTEHQTALAQLEEELARFAALDQELDQAAQALAEHQAAYQAFIRSQGLADTRDQRQAEVARLEEGVAQAQERMAERAQAKAQLAAEFNPQALKERRAQLQEQQRKEGNLRGKLEAEEKEAQDIQEQIRTVQGWQAELEATRVQRQELERQIGLFQELREILKKAGPYITRALVRQISHSAAQLFSEIMLDYSRHLRWEPEDYGIVLEVEGRDRQFSQLSGGEQMSAALAVRLALLREISDVSVAFFDEPTTNLDENRREALAQQILSIQGFRQLFVISHDDTFEQATDNLIRVEKVNGVSVVA